MAREAERGARSRSCYDKALDLLARRSHFRRELTEKLRARSYPDEEIERTLDKLEGNSLIDDRATAEAFVAQRRERNGWGRRRLLAELSRRGVDDAVIDRVLADLDVESELQLARSVARRWRLRSRPDPGTDEGSDKGTEEGALARHLERRGFAPRVIVELLGESDDAPEGL